MKHSKKILRDFISPVFWSTGVVLKLILVHSVRRNDIVPPFHRIEFLT